MVWRPSLEDKKKQVIVPPFKQLNGRMFLSIQEHMKQEHLK